MHIYIYIYIYISLLVQRCLSNMASCISLVFRRVKDHHTLLHCSPLLKKISVRQVAPDKWLSLNPDVSGLPFI